MHRIPKRIHFQVQQSQILGISNFRPFSTQLRQKDFQRKLNYYFLSNPDSKTYAKNADSYKFRIFVNFVFFELTMLIFAFPLPTATRKRVNSGGHPKNAATQKTTHIWALLNK